MASLFRNNYKVYLYKYNYRALQNKIEDLFNENSANKFLFESFVTNLYTLGIPSDELINEISTKYAEYVAEYKNKKSNISNKNKKVVQNTDNSQTIEYKSINDSPDNYIKQERSTVSLENNLLQEALAQNYALQQLQKNYENKMMESSSASINWMSTLESKQTYDTYISKVLDLSKKLLDKVFKPVIDDLEAMQSGKAFNSNYAYVIDLTDLSEFKMMEKVETDRTKYSSNDFITASNKIITDDFSTNAVDSIGAITTTLEGFSNTTSFNLRQNVLLQHGITIEANDIIEIVDTNINQKLNKTYPESNLRSHTQFIGFVTKVSLTQRFNETSLLNVTCEGISKMLSLNPTINSNAVAPQFKSVADFISGKDKTQATSDANVVNVFSTFFDGLNAYDLFIKLLGDTLAVTPIEEDRKAYSMRLISDPDKLRNLPYQYSKPLLILYHLAVTYSTIRNIKTQSEFNNTHIIIARLDNNVNQEKLQAYLLMIRSQFDLFWSNMTTPINILQTLANNTFLEVFEDRTGILILRPPRYNTWIDGDIIEEDDFIEWTQAIDDSSLKSRSDYQWSIPALGVQNEFCGGYYQDIPAMLKYGFRADSPKSSPSVQSEIDAAVYSALDVTKSNSNTRTFELTVPLVNEYKLGNLYYFPDKVNNNLDTTSKISSTGFVGYLTTITTTIIPGNVDTHRLVFKYMRSAECLEVINPDLSSANIKLKILNFKRLPELAMYQDSFTEDMLTKTQKDRLNKKARRLVSNSRYYWASYNKPNKTRFDEAINRDIVITQSEYKKLYRTMAPTNIPVGGFKSLNEIKSSDFIPSQQLINSIWCADILSRVGYTEDDYKINTQDTSVNTKLYTRQLRTKENSKNLLKYLEKDKTIDIYTDTSEINYLENTSDNKFTAPYATVNQKIRKDNENISLGAFLILESTVPNIDTEFAINYNNFIKVYMQNVMNAFKNYHNDDSFYSWYVDNAIFKNSVEKISTKFFTKDETIRKEFTDQMTKIKDCIEAFNLAESNIYKFDEFNNKYTKAYTYMNKLLEYYDERYNSVVFTQVKNIIKNLPGFTTVKTLTDILGITKPSLNSDFIKNVQVGIPAYLVGNSQLPAVHTLRDTGSYVAGVCPVNYKSYIKTLNTNVVNAVLNNTIKFKNNSILNASGTSIGTITKLIYDAELSDGINLYFYPVINLVSDDELAKIYGGMKNLNSILKSTYMFTEEEINMFLQTKKSSKKLACVIRITPTCIPETKIPTIQQIYNQDGLYVGYDKDDNKSFANSRKAIFDPSVMFQWNLSEIEQMYTVNVYNFIECCAGNEFAKYLSCDSKFQTGFLNIKFHNKKIPWNSVIKSASIYKVPCVSNTKLFISKLDIPALDIDTKESIRNYFISLSIANEFEINNCIEESIPNGYMYIKDLKAIDGGNTQLALTFDFDLNLSATHNALIDDEVESSATIEADKSIKSDFIKSVEDKEYTQVNLYNYGPYMPYDTKTLYPNYVLIGRWFLIRKELNIFIKRISLDNDKTIGKMYINNKFFCDTLEDTYRGDNLLDIKVQNETCIPNGRYNVKVETSTISQFGYLPELKNVPNFTNIRIHTGSSTADTSGCILVGDYKNNEWKANRNYVSALINLIRLYSTTYINISIV